MISGSDVAWLAGFIDGCGKLRIECREAGPGRSAQLRLIVSSRNKVAIDKAAAMFGTKVEVHKNWGNHYHGLSMAKSFGYKAAGWCMTLLSVVDKKYRPDLIRAIVWWSKKPMTYKKPINSKASLRHRNLVGPISSRGEFCLT